MEELSSYQIELVLKIGAELGAISTLINTGQIKPYLKASDAFRIFGRKNIERWVEEGLIIVRKDGGRSASWRISRLDCELLAKSHLLLERL